MTSRTRKLMGGVAVVLIAVVVVLVTCNPRPPIVVTFARHVRVDMDDWAVIRITNRSEFEITYFCSSSGGPVDPHVRRLFGDTPPIGNLSPQGMLEIKIPMGDSMSPPPTVLVRCWRVPRGLQQRIVRLRYAIGIRTPPKPWETSLVLLPPPKPSP